MSKRANKRTKVRIFRRAFNRFFGASRIGIARAYRFGHGRGLNAGDFRFDD